MLGGGEVDSLVLMLPAVAVAALAALAIRADPRRALLAFVVVISFVPYWMGVTVAFYLPPATAVAVLATVALVGRTPLRLQVPDALVGAVVVIAVTAFALGEISVHSVVVVVLHWGLAYLLARMLGTAIELHVVYRVVALVLAAAAVLGVVEFATSHNLFIGLGPNSALHRSWNTLQQRGGILRVEGAFGHSIAFGASCAMAVPMAFAARWPTRRVAFVVGALLAGCLVSFSRIGMGTALLGAVASVVLLRSGLGWKVRAGVAVGVAALVAAAAPFVADVYSDAGDEAAGSAQYRADLLGLVPTFRLLGTAASAERSADGVLRFGGFQSIDSAVIYAGLTYGWVIVVLLVLLLLAAVLTVLTGRATAPGIAVAAQVPGVLTVALITQYSAWLWFVGGLAVCAYAGRSATASSPAPHREALAAVEDTGRTGRAALVHR